MLPSDTSKIPAAAREALENFNSASDTVVGSWLKKLNSDPPLVKANGILCHYTSGSGLRGILESGTLWLTDVFDFNDPSELRHGVALAADLLTGRVDRDRPETGLFADVFNGFTKHGGVEESVHYFACCFSSRGDDLGQWRAYGDDGHGFVLEFGADALVGSFAGSGNATFPITYGDAALSAIHAKLIEVVCPLISLPRTVRMTKSEFDEYMKTLGALLSVHVVTASLFFKHEAYSNESEFRFLASQRGDQPTSGLKFRSQPRALVRYREFDWTTSGFHALKRIVLGPAADKSTGIQFARNCLRAFHPNPHSVEIGWSSIPYRTR